jgi:predicted glycosyltransferase
MINQSGTYRIWCTVEGGAIGKRETWFKENDKIYETYDPKEAFEKARNLSTQMNFKNSSAKIIYKVRKRINENL